MANNLKKYMNVDVITFLEEQMKGNTEHYQTDFEIDKKIIQGYADSQRKEDKTLLWMSRTMGTHCQREYEAFIQGSAAHNVWCYYANQTEESIVGYAVELTGTDNGIIRGNLYELDYYAHAALVAAKSVPALDLEKTFEDGFVDRVALDRSSYGYYCSLVDEHGPIIDSLVHPQNEQQLSHILHEQKASRNKMNLGYYEAAKERPSLNEQIQSASMLANDPQSSHQKEKDVIPEL